jgi:hypothetical protein
VRGAISDGRPYRDTDSAELLRRAVWALVSAVRERLKPQHLMLGFRHGMTAKEPVPDAVIHVLPAKLSDGGQRFAKAQRVDKRFERVARAVEVSPAPQRRAEVVTVVCAKWSSFYCTSYCPYIYRGKISITFQQNHFRARTPMNVRDSVEK